jgi:hypothetical protein
MKDLDFFVMFNVSPGPHRRKIKFKRLIGLGLFELNFINLVAFHVGPITFAVYLNKALYITICPGCKQLPGPSLYEQLPPHLYAQHGAVAEHDIHVR